MNYTFDELTVTEQGEKVAGCQYWQDAAFGDPEALAHHLHLDGMVAEWHQQVTPYEEAMAG